MRDYLLTLVVAAAVTYLLTPLVRRGAILVGALKQPRERDIHTAPVPTLGGVAMFAGLAAGLFVADQIPQLRVDAFGQNGMVPGLLLAGGLLVAMGIVDDRWGLSWLTKLAGQIAAGAILVATGTQLNWLPLPGGATFATTPNESTLLTILIVVATINAVNFIDGLDGLAAGIVAIAAASFLIYYYSMAKVVDVSALAAPALASAILTGICLGFLPHNFHPARIFMGDTGAMLLGLILAYAPISSIASLDPAVSLLSSRVNRYPEIMPLLLPAILLVIPYADLLLAVIRRTRAGLSPFAADQKHLHHRLLQIGHSQRASVLVMYLWALLFSGSVVWFSLERTATSPTSNHHGQPVFVFVIITAAAVVALLLMAMPAWRNRDRVLKPDPGASAASQAPGRTPAAAGAGANSASAVAGGHANNAPAVTGGRANGASASGRANGASASGRANGASANGASAVVAASPAAPALAPDSLSAGPASMRAAPVPIVDSLPSAPPASMRAAPVPIADSLPSAPPASVQAAPVPIAEPFAPLAPLPSATPPAAESLVSSADVSLPAPDTSGAAGAGPTEAVPSAQSGVRSVVGTVPPAVLPDPLTTPAGGYRPVAPDGEAQMQWQSGPATPATGGRHALWPARDTRRGRASFGSGSAPPADD